MEDVAPALLLFMGIGILATATKQPQFVAALHPLVGDWLRNPIAYVVVFGLASPLTLYRGPLNPFGVGIAVFTVLASSHVLAAVVLVAAVMAVVQVQNVCDPTNTANVWIANFTGVQIETLTKRTLPFQVGVAVLATLAVVLLSSWLFGAQAFASALPVARAAVAELPGLYAPGTSRRTNRCRGRRQHVRPRRHRRHDRRAERFGHGAFCGGRRGRRESHRLHRQTVCRVRRRADFDVPAHRRNGSRCRDSARRLRRLDRERMARPSGVCGTVGR